MSCIVGFVIVITPLLVNIAYMKLFQLEFSHEGLTTVDELLDMRSLLEQLI
jgi:hypothetical protein